jgi:hypothetical protein
VTETKIRRYTGMFGLIASLFIIVQVPLYFIYETPPDWNILTRSLIGIIACTVYIIYFIGLRQLIRHANPAYDWIGSTVQMAGVLWAAMVFVPQSMEVGAAISVDCPLVRPTLALAAAIAAVAACSAMVSSTGSWLTSIR